MGNIYTGIELGTNSVKVVVLEKNNDLFHVLGAISSVSSGIKNGQIVDMKQAITSVKKAIKEVDDMLGIKISKVVACVPPANCKMDIVLGSCEVNDSSNITGEDVSNVISDALKGQKFDSYELVSAIPISFKVDNVENIKDPKGMSGDIIEVRVVVSTLPKEGLYRILEVLKLSGVETVDVVFSSTGDYYTIKNPKYDDVVGAIINIGESATNVSIFNKGIQIKHSIVPIGSKNVDKDIAYIYKLNVNAARRVKENFAVCMHKYADVTDVIEAKNSDGNKKEITQVEVSKIVEARLKEILKLAKNEIKNLTNREIRYIIITGGQSEMAGFSYLVEEEFGTLAKVCNINMMGIRHNKYSSAVGAIKYFDDKLALRGKEYNMLNNEDIESIISTQQRLSGNDNLIGKVFGHFFDN